MSKIPSLQQHWCHNRKLCDTQDSMLLAHAQRQLCSQQQARCSTCIHFRRHKTLYIRVSRECVASIAPAAAPTAVAAAAAAKSDAVPVSTGRVLFVGGLPGAEDPDTIAEQLAALCAQWKPTHIEVARFKRESEKSKFAAGWKHKGHALVAFTSATALTAAAESVRRLSPWSCAISVGPAQKVPSQWPLELTLTPQEVAELRQQQAAAEQRRAHNRRQRARQQQRLIDSVDMLITGLPAPAGRSVLQQYKPLVGQQLQQYLVVQHQYNALPGVLPDHQVMSTSSLLGSTAAVQADRQLQQAQASEQQCNVRPEALPNEPDHTTNGTTVEISQQYSLADRLLALMPDPLRRVIRRDRLLHLLSQHQQQQQPGLIRLDAAPSVAAVEQQLLFDWSKMPAVVDPAFGGRLADADVVRAGAGRMNMRTLRKRVQVESFALLLLQLTLPALAADTPLHIVEFGSGSGNLVLPLAHLFPCFQFSAIDMKASAVQLLRQRVQQGGIANVVNMQEGTIEMYSGPADVVLALHACGAASDWALAQAAARTAAFIVSPCCIGKINKSNTVGLLYGTSSSTSTEASSSSSSVDGGSGTSSEANSSRGWSSPTAASSSSNSSSCDGCAAVSSSERDVDAWLVPKQPARQKAATVVQQAVQHALQQTVQQERWQAVQQEAWQAVQQAQLLQYPRSLWLTRHLSELAVQVHAGQQQQQQQQQLQLAPVSHQQFSEHQQQQQQEVATTSRVLNKLQQVVLQSDSREVQCRAIFSLLAQAADYSHQEDHGYPDLAAVAKSNVEFDRGMHMVEEGYEVVLLRLLQPQLTAKSDVLVGIPKVAASDMATGPAAAAAMVVDEPVTALQRRRCVKPRTTVHLGRRFSWLWH